MSSTKPTGGNILTEYYRARLRAMPDPIKVEGLGGSWRFVQLPLGDCYQQEETGCLLPRALFEEIMLAARAEVKP